MTSRKSKAELPPTLSEDKKNRLYQRSTFKQLIPMDCVKLADDRQAGVKNDGCVAKGHASTLAGKKQRKRAKGTKDKSPKRQTSAQSRERRSRSRARESDRTRLSVQVHIARLSGKSEEIMNKNMPTGAESKVSYKNDTAKKSGKRNGKTCKAKRPARLSNSEANKSDCKSISNDGVVGNVRPKVERGPEKSVDKQSVGTEQTPAAMKKGSSQEMRTVSNEAKSKDTIVKKEMKRPGSVAANVGKAMKPPGSVAANVGKAMKPPGSVAANVGKAMKLPGTMQSSTSSGSDYNYSPDQDWETTYTTASSSGDSGPTNSVFIIHEEGCQDIKNGKEVEICKESPLDRKEPLSANNLRDKGQDDVFKRNDGNKVVFNFINVPVESEQDKPENVKEDQSTSTISTASLRETTSVGDASTKRKKQHSPRPRPRRARALSPNKEKKMATINAVISETSISVGRLTSAINASSSRKPPIIVSRIGTSNNECVPTGYSKRSTLLKSSERRESPSIERSRKGVHNSPSKPRRRLKQRETEVMCVKRESSKQKSFVRDTISTRSVRQIDRINDRALDTNEDWMTSIDCPVQRAVAMKTSKVRFEIPDEQITDESSLSLSSERSVNSDRYQASSSVSSIRSDTPEYYDSECSTCNGKRDRSYYDSDCSTFNGRRDQTYFDSDCSTCSSSRGFSDSDSDNEAGSQRSQSQASISSDTHVPLSAIPRSKPFIASTKPGKKQYESPENNEASGGITRAKPFIVSTKSGTKGVISPTKSRVSPTKTENARMTSPSILPRCYSARSIRSKDVTNKSSTNIPRLTSAKLKNTDLSKVAPRSKMYAEPVSSHPKSERKLIKYLQERSTTTQSNTSMKSKVKNSTEPTRRRSNQNGIQLLVHEGRDTKAKDKRTIALPRCATLGEIVRVKKAKSSPIKLASNASEQQREIVKKTSSCIGTRDNTRQSKIPRPVTRGQVTVAVKPKKIIQDKAVHTGDTVNPKKSSRSCVQTRLPSVKRGEERNLEQFVQKKSGQNIELGSAIRSRYVKTNR